ncbi:hypothetical protein [Gilliamella apis]|uniref:hypothetical protein n=1 Tax=Gilliamella apis TaxID=1970738 RepID=UPI002432A411|nr:hypothetical protein [Gilliamella apis]
MKEISLYLIELRRNYRLSNNKNKDKGNVLFKEIGFWSVFFTALLYVNAYICEGMTAIYFGFDVDLISLPMSVIIKNNLIPFALITIAVIIILSNIKNDKKLTIDDVNTADNTKKYNILKFVGSLLFIFLCVFIFYKTNVNLEGKILAFVLGAIMSLACGYFLDIKIIKNNSKLTHLFVASNIFFIFSCFYIYILVSWINLLLVIISILLLFILFCIYSIVQSDNILKSCCWLAGLFICLIGGAGALSLYLVIDNFKPDQSFKYNGQDYILLRNYDGNLVAKKATIIQQEKYCFNDEILYLPKEILKEGLTFKKVNKVNFKGDCKAKASNPTN